MTSDQTMKFDTKVVRAGITPDPTTGSIVPPIYETATYVLPEVGKDKGFDYTRSSNPTRQVLEENLAALENGDYGICFSSGMAAVDSVTKLLSAGDHVVSSDDVYIGEPDNVITSFLRCDRGDEYTDHHTLLCVGVGEPGFDHAAFEVEDLDALMVGHDLLAEAGYEHHAGVGRHLLGSQIFDYWRDPWGHVIEHFTDGDLLDAGHVAERHDPAAALGTQWGKFVAS